MNRLAIAVILGIFAHAATTLAGAPMIAPAAPGADGAGSMVWLAQATEGAAERTSEVAPPANPVERVQRGLAAQGYDPGPIDGAMGPSTRAAIRDFQRARGLTVDGQVSEALIAALEQPAPERGDAPATAEDEPASEQAAAEDDAAEPDVPTIEITEDPSTYDLGNLEDLNTFD